MAAPEPDHPPEPHKEEHTAWPLIINGVLMLMLYLVAAAASGSRRGDTALTYFFLLVGLLLMNIVGAIIAAIIGKSRTAKAFLFSMLGIFLIGLGTCAYSLQHFHLDTR